MSFNIKRIALSIIGIVFALLSLGSALAYRYEAYPPSYGYGGPIYTSGYYYNTYSYGYSGWNYNRVHYRYHYPYSTYNYYNYPNYWYGGPWVAHYAYRVYPMYGGYPFGGMYW